MSNLGLTNKQIDELEKRNKPTGRLTLNAPTGGIVTEMNAEKGGRVKSNAPLFAIADPTRLWINLDVPVVELQRLEIGQQVTMATDAHPGAKFSGRIEFIGPTVDRTTRTLKVRVDYSNPDRKLKLSCSFAATCIFEKNDAS